MTMLKGKKILVTGSSRGIGLGAARACSEHGARVIYSSERPLGDCPEVNDCLVLPGSFYLQADLSLAGAAESLVRDAWGHLDGLDVLINNVGTFREPSFGKLRREDFDFVFGLNVWSAIAASQEFARLAIRDGKGGRILFTTSLNGSRSEPGHTLYDASKGAIDSITRQLAIELAPHGITTAAIAPGLVETPLTDMGLRSDPAARQTVLDQIPLRRIAAVDDLAMWYVFLSSDGAGYATGSVFKVDGGLDAQQMAIRPIIAGEKRPGLV